MKTKRQLLSFFFCDFLTRIEFSDRRITEERIFSEIQKGKWLTISLTAEIFLGNHYFSVLLLYLQPEITLYQGMNIIHGDYSVQSFARNLERCTGNGASVDVFWPSNVPIIHHVPFTTLYDNYVPVHTKTSR